MEAEGEFAPIPRDKVYGDGCRTSGRLSSAMTRQGEGGHDGVSGGRAAKLADFISGLTRPRPDCSSPAALSI